MFEDFFDHIGISYTCDYMHITRAPGAGQRITLVDLLDTVSPRHSLSVNPGCKRQGILSSASAFFRPCFYWGSGFLIRVDLFSNAVQTDFDLSVTVDNLVPKDPVESKLLT
jgi:hypothetical protein